MRFHLIPIFALLAAAVSVGASEEVQTVQPVQTVERGSANYSPDAKSLAFSTSRNYTTDYNRIVQASIEAIEEEAHVKLDQIERTDSGEGCSCGSQVTVLKAPYIDFSWIKVKIDGRGKDSCAPELSVTITTDKTFFTRHKEYEQRIHELVLLKLNSKQHGEESKPSMLPPTHVKPPPAAPAPAAPPAPGATTPGTPAPAPGTAPKQ